MREGIMMDMQHAAVGAGGSHSIATSPQTVDVHLPTTAGRTLILSRYTEPEQDQQLLLDRLYLLLPAQPPPRIAAPPQALTA
jgi:hypothetical protein